MWTSYLCLSCIVFQTNNNNICLILKLLYIVKHLAYSKYPDISGPLGKVETMYLYFLRPYKLVFMEGRISRLLHSANLKSQSLSICLRSSNSMTLLFS